MDVPIKISGIYLLRNKETGKRYVGQSWDVEERWSRHPRDRYGKKGYLQNAIRKYGWDAFEKRLLIVVGNQEDLDRYEIECIKLYDTLAPNGYNLREGGNGGRMHADTKKKLSDAKKGQRSWNKGKSSSLSTRAKISISRSGQPSWNKDKKGYKLKTIRSKVERDAIAIRQKDNRNGSKLTKEQVVEIRATGANTKKKYIELAAKYQVHFTTVQNIYLGYSWKGLT